VIVTKGLTKRYGHVVAVDHVDLEVREGDRYGFLGPNGSGKTTLVRMLLGLVYATSGQIEVLGQPVPRRIAEVLPRIGALVEAPSAYGHLSGRANLALIDAAGPHDASQNGDSRYGGGRYGGGALTAVRTRRRRVQEALDRVGLGGVDDRAVKKYSLGMKQRLGLAAALLRTPRLLILDEPTNGLDPQGIHEIRGLLTELNAAGTTVFMSSHQLAEVELLCTRVGVIDHGRLVVQDDLAAIRGPTGRVIVRSPDADRAAALLAGRVAGRDDDRLVVTGAGPAGADPIAVNAELVSAGLRVSEVSAERRSLEDVVLSVTSAGSDRIDGAGRADGAQPLEAAPPEAAPPEAAQQPDGAQQPEGAQQPDGAGR
jgi:ABC-type multidrug transport system ATPase subunit